MSVFISAVPSHRKCPDNKPHWFPGVLLFVRSPSVTFYHFRQPYPQLTLRFCFCMRRNWVPPPPKCQVFHSRLGLTQLPHKRRHETTAAAAEKQNQVDNRGKMTLHLHFSVSTFELASLKLYLCTLKSLTQGHLTQLGKLRFIPSIQWRRNRISKKGKTALIRPWIALGRTAPPSGLTKPTSVYNKTRCVTNGFFVVVFCFFTTGCTLWCILRCIGLKKKKTPTCSRHGTHQKDFILLLLLLSRHHTASNQVIHTHSSSSSSLMQP